jgi:hypothetical protein
LESKNEFGGIRNEFCGIRIDFLGWVLTEDGGLPVGFGRPAMKMTGEGGLLLHFPFFSGFVFYFGVLFSPQVCAFFLKC